MKTPTNNTPNTPLEGMSDSSWEDNPILNWLFKYGKILLSLLVALLLGVLLIYRLMSGSYSSENLFFQADEYYQILVSKPNSPAAVDALSKLQPLLKKYPELHAKYDGLIAQILLNENQIDLGSRFAQEAIARTRTEEQPFYAQYAENTLSIAKQDYKDALTRSLALKQQMAEQKPAVNHTLFAFNLMRIAILQNQLNLPEELQSWLEWKQFVTASQDSNLMEALSNLDEGRVSIMTFAESRINMLQK